jgi:DNA-binding NarL/FixJ family response regulator
LNRILIADDHLMFATALQFLLRALDAEIETVAVGSVGYALQQLASDPRFDLVLLDLVMPHVDGLEGLQSIKAGHPTLPVAILSGSSDASLVRKALAMGAIGWLPKTMSGEPLIHALRLMIAGQQFCPPEFLQTAMPTPGYSAREADVANLLAAGLTDKEIGNRLSIQLGTVKVHVKRLLKKSGAENRTKFALIQRER